MAEDETGADSDLEEGVESELFEHHRIVVDRGQSLLRVDKFLLNLLANATRNRIQHAALAGNVLVNTRAVKSNYRVKPGDVISLVLSFPPRDTEIYPENLPLSLLYEDDELLIVNKAAGMVVHPGFNNYSGTLVNGLVYHFQQLPALAGNERRPGLVHRIDKDTTGLVLISKQEASLSFLARQFYEHTIKRTYHALVWGDLPDQGTIQGYIGRSAKDRRVMDIFSDEQKGKWSVTHFKVLERFSYCTLVECRLETGRTHQIRAHFKSIGHPLFGDSSYGGDRVIKGPPFTKYKQFIQNCLLLMPAQALHAKTLGFIHPATKCPVEFDSELPVNFQQLLHKWRTYSGEATPEGDLPDDQSG